MHNLFYSKTFHEIPQYYIQWDKVKRTGNFKGVKNSIRDIKQKTSGKRTVNCRGLQKQN